MINHSIDIYFFTGSPPSRATLLLVKALGIKHNVKIVDVIQRQQYNPEFLKLNPLHTIPTINDNGFVLWDSHVIMKYLVDQYAKDDSLCPRDPKKSAIVNQRLFFNATTLFPAFVGYCAPVLFADQQPDPEKAGKVEETFGILDNFLEGQIWIAGSSLTIADFAIISIISTAEAVGFDISKYSNLNSWYQRLKNAMSGFGYEDVMQAGSNFFGVAFKSKLKSSE